jgi:NADPH:quinone reductase
VEVTLSSNADLDAEVAALDAVIAAYSSPSEQVELPFWPLLFKNVTIRLLSSDDFPASVKQQAARELTQAAADGQLEVPVAKILPLTEVAAAHSLVDSGARGRVLVRIRPSEQSTR